MGWRRNSGRSRAAGEQKPLLVDGHGSSGGLRIALVYAAVAAAWIVFSDLAVDALVTDPLRRTVVQTAKGWFYVAATSLLLYALVRRHTDALTASEAGLRSVIESMADAVLVVSGDRRVVDVNAAGLRLLGFQTREQAVGSLEALRTRLRWRTPDAAPAGPEADPVQRALRGETMQRHEVLLTREDGTELWLSVSVAPVNGPGGARTAVAVLRDISEVKRLERLRDQFLSTAAHELKTPVAAIKGWVQMLGRWSPEGRPERERAAFQVLERQSARLARLVDDLLEASRLQLGRTELRRQALELGDLAAEAVARMQAISPRHRLELVREAPATVLGDRDRLEQVLVNLLDNAVRFSPEGGPVVATVAAAGGEALVSVRDRGVGIPADRRDRVFKPFAAAHAGTRWDYCSGLGIGLHISREIVERHGGRIWFDTEEGAGSTFRFALPLTESGAAA